jgi:hypothetical protein
VFIRAARPGPAQARKGPTRLISGRPGPVLNSGRAVPAHGPTPRPTARISLNVSCFKRAARNKKWPEIKNGPKYTFGPEIHRDAGRRGQRPAAAPVALGCRDAGRRGAEAVALAQGRPRLQSAPRRSRSRRGGRGFCDRLTGRARAGRRAALRLRLRSRSRWSLVALEAETAAGCPDEDGSR